MLNFLNQAGDAVLEVVFEVDVNGILKVTATEKTSGRSANITISNSVGKLSSSEIESMINGQQLDMYPIDPVLTVNRRREVQEQRRGFQQEVRGQATTRVLHLKS